MIRPEDLALLLDRVDLSPPPPGFATGQLFTTYLRIYFLDHAGRRFWIWDAKGFLCSTNDMQVVGLLLRAESTPNPDESRPHLRKGARELLFPGSALAHEAEAQKLQSAARKVAEGYRAKRLADKPDFSDGMAVLKTLGLD